MRGDRNGSVKLSISALVLLVTFGCGDEDFNAVDEDGFLAPLSDGQIRNGTCVPEGERFKQSFDCTEVEGPGPGLPEQPSTSKISAADPERLDDFDTAWVQAQLNACSCVCCHSQGGKSAHWWALDFPPHWPDSALDSALVSLAGDGAPADKSEYLNPAKNNGFIRQYGPPTTDPERMRAFFLRQIDFRQSP